jgi:hypothetical protein
LDFNIRPISKHQETDTSSAMSSAASFAMAMPDQLRLSGGGLNIDAARFVYRPFGLKNGF